MSFDFLHNIQWAEISPYIYALYGALVLCLTGQLYFYFGPFRRVIRHPDGASASAVLPPISVVMCARNEQDNLAKNLPLFLAQDYPQFEVVVVNDCSTDDSEMLLYTMRQNHPNLTVTSIGQDQKFLHDRKLAITVGIKAAQHEQVVFAEPDCAPSSNRWLASMQQAFGDDGELVISYCRNEPQVGFADKIMRTDSVFSSLLSLHAALQGKPYRASFKNLGMKRNLFFGSKGFANHNLYPMSEETLFLCRNANAGNTRVSLASDSFLAVQQPLTFAQWFRQKCIFASLRNMGKRGGAALRAEMATRTLYMLCAVALITVSIVNVVNAVDVGYLLLLAALPLLLLRFVVKLVMLHKAAKKLQEPNLLAWQLLYDALSPLLAFVVAMGQPNLQKIRKIK
jgi:hypothetical protein